MRDLPFMRPAKNYRGISK